MDKRIIPLILGAMAVVIVAIGVLVWLQMRGPGGTAGGTGDSTDYGATVDSSARIEIEQLRTQIESLTQKTQSLESRLRTLEDGRTGTAPAPQDQAFIPHVGPNRIIDSYAKVVLIADRRDVNKGVNIATPTFLTSLFGPPSDHLSEQCQPMTNERLRDKLETAQVGPIHVRMLRPAIDSLTKIFSKIKATDPDLYARINTSGALCVRLIRGSASSVSTHAFGLSLDLNIDGKLDTLGDGKTQLGLTILADFFRNAGWYWGAGFSREDSMHFEVGRDLVEKWISDGQL